MTDEKWARKEWRREVLVKAVTAGVLLSLAVGVLTIFQNRGQDKEITKITRTVESPCQTAPAGQECAAIRRAVALREPRANPCVSYQRVTGKKGKNCDRFYVRRSASQGPSFNTGSADDGGSQTSPGAGVNASPGGDQDGSVQGGVGGQGDGSKPKGQAPATDSPSTSNAPSVPDQFSGESSGNSEGNGSSESSKANPVAEGVGGTVEGVGDVVRETGETVNGAVEGVTGKACGLVGADC